MAEFKNIIKHSRNYLIANIATKALAFITIPVYTRLLSTNEYGTISIFLSVSTILSSIMALSMDRSISRYYFDQKDIDDFRQFNGTTFILSIFAFILTSLIIFKYSKNIGNIVNLESNIVILLIPFSLINIIALSFQQIYGPRKESKLIATTSLFQAYIGFSMSILFVAFLPIEKHFSVILGKILGGIIICFFYIKYIKPFFKLYFGIFYVRYIFTYSVPLIPYALSGVIIEQFGKIALGSTQSVSDAGYYSLALAIGSLVSIIIGVTHQAWNPYFMEYMNDKNYKQLDSDYIRIFKITIIVAFFIASFGYEIGLILAKREFTESLYLIPIFTIGYVFYQLSYTYLRNFGYSKKTYLLTITVLLSGISNLLFNYFLIPVLNELGATLAFVGSYIIMAALGYLINRFFLKTHATSLKELLTPFFISVPFYIFLIFIYSLDLSALIILIKTGMFLLLTYFILIGEKTAIINISKRFLASRK